MLLESARRRGLNGLFLSPSPSLHKLFDRNGKLNGSHSLLRSGEPFRLPSPPPRWESRTDLRKRDYSSLSRDRSHNAAEDVLYNTSTLWPILKEVREKVEAKLSEQKSTDEVTSLNREKVLCQLLGQNLDLPVIKDEVDELGTKKRSADTNQTTSRSVRKRESETDRKSRRKEISRLGTAIKKLRDMKPSSNM
eukprot:TRINITY_DN3742_c0_g1_i1.p1 TRINITY_DN3742_c0_g1~~TRINITY_DN3742_c0_g1_i1.p1  ORF type:complete len:193 (-),score=25.83 TRINITY_DN3742_c0_g1_i1:99-677(-)